MKTAYVQDRVFNYGYCLGGTGLAGEAFFYPSGFALGSNGTLYVLNKGEEFVSCAGITKLNLDSEYIWESRGDDFAKGRGPFPSAIAVDSAENVYVADEFKNQIYVFDSDGNPLGDWRPGQTSDDTPSNLVFPAPNTAGDGVSFDLILKKEGAWDTSADGELNGPMGLAFSQDDRMYVSDSYNHRVQVFTKDGEFLGKWGRLGCEEGEFNLPWGITVDKEGCVYVADWKNARVQKFSSDGEFVAVFGGPDSGEGRLQRPSGVAVDNDGDVYVADWGAHCLKIYAPDGSHMLTLLGDADRLPPWQQAKVNANVNTLRARQRADLSQERYFRRPVAVQVDNEGRIIVLETVSNRLQVYIKEQDWIEPPFNQ